MSRFSRLGRWPSVIALLAFLSFARAPVAFGNHDCPGDLPFTKYLCDQGNSFFPSTLGGNTRLLIVYWGPEWTQGFITTTPSGQLITSAQYQLYLETFLTAIQGTDYLASQTPYGAGNPVPLLTDTWIDTNEPPLTPQEGDIEQEVQNAQVHFADPNPDIFLIALPPTHGDSTFMTKGGPFCARHGNTLVLFLNQASQGIFNIFKGPIAYHIVFPYQPDAPNCTNFVNQSSDGFGHGIFDGVSVVVGHELAETLTDPGLGSWQDTNGQETGDKCQTFPKSNIGYYQNGQGFYWAAQSLWSNSAVGLGLGIPPTSGCVFGDLPSICFLTQNGGCVTPPSSVDFGPQDVGVKGASNTQTVSAGNVGTADLPNVSQPSPWQLDDPNQPKSFFFVASPCPQVLHPGDQCSVQVGFVPAQTGSLQATLYFNSNSGGNVQHVTSTALKGTGVSAPGISWSGILHTDFGLLSVLPCEECPKVQGIEILNQDRSSPHKISNVRVGGLSASDFATANDGCSGITLQPGQSCTVQILFAPQATGERFGRLDFLDETGSQHNAVLTGVGLGPSVQLAASDLTTLGLGFPNGSLGTTHVEPITLTAGGQSSLNIKSIIASGDFTQTNNCPSLLALGSRCTIRVALTPTQYGFQSGNLTVNDDASDSPQIVRLTGTTTGSFALVSSNNLGFGFVPLNIASNPLRVSLTAVEGEPFHISSIAASGDFSETNDCPTAPSPLGAFCTISVGFTPHATGSQTGSLTIVDDATNGNQSIALSGTGAGLASGGAFVIGDGDAALGKHVTFWGSQWASANTLSGGAAPASFKGFENGVVNAACGTAWSAGPGNSSKPPGTVPTYMAVIVSSKISKQGSRENGNTASIAVVQTDPGYQPDPGHPGTGTVVGKACN